MKKNLEGLSKLVQNHQADPVIGHRRTDNQTIAPVQKAPVPGNEVAGILQTGIPFQEGLAKIAELSGHGDNNSHEGSLPEIKTKRMAFEDVMVSHVNDYQPETDGCQQTANGTFHGLFRAYLRIEQVLAVFLTEIISKDIGGPNNE